MLVTGERQARSPLLRRHKGLSDGIEAPVLVAVASQPCPFGLPREHHLRRVIGRGVLDPPAGQQVVELMMELRQLTLGQAMEKMAELWADRRSPGPVQCGMLGGGPSRSSANSASSGSVCGVILAGERARRINDPKQVEMEVCVIA